LLTIFAIAVSCCGNMFVYIIQLVTGFEVVIGNILPEVRIKCCCEVESWGQHFCELREKNIQWWSMKRVTICFVIYQNQKKKILKNDLTTTVLPGHTGNIEVNVTWLDFDQSCAAILRWGITIIDIVCKISVHCEMSPVQAVTITHCLSSSICFVVYHVSLPTVCCSDDNFVFSTMVEFLYFLCQHDNSWAAKFCVNMYLDNHRNPSEFQGHRLKVKVTGPDFWLGKPICSYHPSCAVLQLCR